MQNQIDRRDFIKASALSAAAFGLPGLARSDDSAQARPNIIFILADDMGYGDLNCQNPESKIPTPNLDKLAEQGVRFTDAHSASAVCSPSRYSILTGRYCFRTRLKMGVLAPWDPPLIKKDRLTVGGLLRSHGYHTACVGKWHLGMNYPATTGLPPWPRSTPWNVDLSGPIAGGPIERGFDYYFGVDWPNSPPYCFIENNHTIGIPTIKKPKTMHGRPGPMLPGWDLENVMPALTEKAVEYVDMRAGSNDPFFLYLPLTAPHTPVAPASEFKGKTEIGPYGDFVYQVDDTVGQVMQALQRNDLAENTLIIFTSDNGSPGRDGSGLMSGPIGSVENLGHDPSGELRGRKGDCWDGGHRTPFIARWPGRIKSGSTCDQTISQVDFMATVSSILGDKLPETAGEDSYDISPALFHGNDAETIREATVHHSHLGMFAIRQGRWKLILGRGSGSTFSYPPYKIPMPGQPKGQLYDIKADLAETNNLYDEHPDVVARLSKLLKKYRKEGRSAPIA